MAATKTQSDAQIRSLNKMLANREERIDRLTRDALKRDAQIAALIREADIRDREIQSLEQAVAEAGATLSEVYSSTSWRISAPVRWLRRALDRATPLLRRWLPNSDFTGADRIKGGVVFSEKPSGPVRLGSAEAFDAAFYLAAYPDVAAAGVDPYVHYVTWGRKGGRLGAPPRPPIHGDLSLLDERLATVLTVSHDASRTGAPILTLNLAERLGKEHNVIGLLLGEGGLVADFKERCDVVIGPFEPARDHFIASAMLGELLGDVKLSFAIVNSIESRHVLPFLARRFVPTLALVHEFASYTRPRHAMSEAALWASKVVFSAPVVAENARGECPGFATHPPVILPQGRTQSPKPDASPEEIARETAKVGDLVRPASCPEDTVIVLGVGTVQLRKGADLFLACAARVRELSPRSPFRFVWAGHGFDPEHDATYSVYLQDQIARSNLSELVSFVGELVHIETAFELADLLFLSSRLDPLPNVAIEAMACRIPVVCFDRTTGIADALRGGGLAEPCVAPYLDIDEAAQRLVRLMDDPVLRLRIGNESRALGAKLFDMETYFQSLERLALHAASDQEQERRDCETIAGANDLRMDFFPHPDWADAARTEVVRRYVRSWATGVGERKPFPGFHPGIYQEALGLSAEHRDPFAHFIEAGRPRGPWLCDLIDSTRANTVDAPHPRTALHIHAYYPELLNDILERLKGQNLQLDLLVSVATRSAADEVDGLLRRFGLRAASLDIVPNRGRDIGPLLTGYRALLRDRYDLVGHVHTKKTADVKDATMGETWLRFLLENLIGGRQPMATRIIQRMAADDKVGLVFPDEPNIVDWGENRDEAEKLAQRLGIANLPDRHFRFPVGTMFWARVEALAPLFELELDWDDYPREPVPYDGTMLHALERVIPFAASKSGFKMELTNVPDVTR